MICIGFGTNEKWLSRLIRWATRSPWSHAWIEYPSGVWGGRWVAQAWPKGIVKVPLKQVEEMYTTRRVYECKPNMEAGFQWAGSRLYADYDYGVIWNGLLLVLHRVTGWAWLNQIVHRNTAKLSCSEFAAGFLKTAGVRGAESLDPELTTPGALEKFCSSSDDFWVV